MAGAYQNETLLATARGVSSRGVNLASLVDQNIAEFGEYPATVFEDRWYTNREQAERSFRFAGALRALGIGPGDRVVVMLPNCPEVPQSYGAILRIGGVVVPVLFLLAAQELRHIVRDSEAKVLITSPEFAPKAFEATADIDPAPAVIVAGGAPTGALAYEELVSSSSPDVPVVDRAGSDPALFMYTSGTTGRPKGVVLTHGNMLHQAEAGHAVSEMEPTKVALGALPMAHAAGLVGWVIGLRHGARAVLLRWFDPEQFFRSVERYRVAGTALVPTMASFLLHHPAADSFDTSSLEQVAFGAAPCPVELVRAFEEKFSCRVRIAYGLTEAAPLLTIDRPSVPRKDGACGVAIPGVEIAVFDPQDRPLSPGEIGEIVARGPNVMVGYHNLPEETERALRGGWLHTGDLGTLDEDGYLFVVDRVKDMIIRGGFNIYPRDVEEVLYAHPGVADAAVVGIPDETYGEEVEAFVVRAPGAEVTEGELIALCRERLAGYKCPKRVTFVPDLPRNQIGKVLKRELRARASAERPGAALRR
jgi:long-chain acyl-CoA synthetase